MIEAAASIARAEGRTEWRVERLERAALHATSTLRAYMPRDRNRARTFDAIIDAEGQSNPKKSRCLGSLYEAFLMQRQRLDNNAAKDKRDDDDDADDDDADDDDADDEDEAQADREARESGPSCSSVVVARPVDRWLAGKGPLKLLRQLQEPLLELRTALRACCSNRKIADEIRNAVDNVAMLPLPEQLRETRAVLASRRNALTPQVLRQIEEILGIIVACVPGLATR
jgi:hypothetical protein